MVIFDVKELARNLLVPSPDLGVREHLVCELIRGALEIFNDPHAENRVITELEEVLENDYDVLGADKLVTGMLTTMREQAQRCGWDKRTVAKAEFKVVGQAYHRASIIMDLDDTFARMLERDMPKQDAEHVTDMVCDNPDMDQLNELNQLHLSQTERKTPLLSDRFATVVQEDETRGWRVSGWEDFGRNISK